MARLKTILPGQPDAHEIKRMIEAINVQLQKQRHPFEIAELAGGYQFRTVPYYQAWVRQLFKEKASRRLSVQTLETLAIISYKQDITKAEIETIRGVECDGAMKTLLERHLITITGRSEKPGRPLLYGTTNEFLTYFGLNKVSDLPNIEEFEALAREKLGDMSEVMLEEEAKAPQTENLENTGEDTTSNTSGSESENSVPTFEVKTETVSNDASASEMKSASAESENQTDQNN